MEITLMKDHVTPLAEYKAGETIEVTEQEYDWLMSIYAADRRLEMAEYNAVMKLGTDK